MTAVKTTRTLLALLVAVVLACSLFTVGVVAGEENTTAATETTGEETTVGEETTAGEETTSGKEEESTTKKEEESTTKKEEETTTAAEKNFWEKNFMLKDKPYWLKIATWALVILGLIAGVVFCVIKREKVGEFLRALKSELKRIVWSSWKDTRKNTLVVLVVVIAITLVIYLFNLVLEMIFGSGTSSGSGMWFNMNLVSLIKKLITSIGS